MKKFKLILSFVAIISLNVLAEETVKLGVIGQVGVDGFFSPTVNSFFVKSVMANSPAEKVGLVAGDKIISIDGCKIPGCSASKAKKLMQKKAGEILLLVIEKQDGSQVTLNIAMNSWQA